MPSVQFTRHLRMHFPDLADVEVEGATLADVVAQLDRLHPASRPTWWTTTARSAST